MKFSAFAPFGALQFKAGQPIERSFYDAIIRALGEGSGLSVEPGSFTDCFAFMAARLIGFAARKLDRGADQMFAQKVYDLLAVHEAEHKIVPSPTATIPQRKRALLAKKQGRQGSRPAALGEQLRTLLGADFVGLHIIEPSERAVWPADLNDQPMLLAPADMDRKIATNILPISVNLGSPHVLPYISIDPALEDGSGIFRVGDKVILEPEILGRCERLVVNDVGTTTINNTTYNTITVTPNNAHEPLCTIASIPYPLWMSTQREMVIVVKPSVVQSTSKMRQIHNLLDQSVTGVSTWAVVQESPAGSGQFGQLTLDDPVLGLLDANSLDAGTVNVVF
jgi:hypothetical protein